jgi:hypothetical protein
MGHTVIATFTDAFSQVTSMLDYFVRDVAPTTWMLIALAFAAVWMLFVQPE